MPTLTKRPSNVLRWIAWRRRDAKWCATTADSLGGTLTASTREGLRADIARTVRRTNLKADTTWIDLDQLPWEHCSDWHPESVVNQP